MLLGKSKLENVNISFWRSWLVPQVDVFLSCLFAGMLIDMPYSILKHLSHIVSLLLTGCLNGGGQIKPKPGESAKDLIQSLELKYMENVSLGFRLYAH